MTFEERIARILKRSGQEYVVQDVLDKINNKLMYAFEVCDTLLLIEIHSFPQKRVLHVWGMEGRGTLKHLDAIVAWVKELARALECDELRCQGRSGWAKALQQHGAVPLYTTLVMGLS